jgi:tetratricopeptide (TPR) repeat protein
MSRASVAVLRGDFIDARRELAVVRELAVEHELSRARMSFVWAAVSIAGASRDAAYAESILDDVRPIARAIGNVARGTLAYALALAGRIDEARAELCDDALPKGIVLAQLGTEAVLLVGARERYEQALDALVPALALYPMAVATAGSLLLRPVALAIGELQLELGRRDDAIASIESGLALARTINAVPFVAAGEALLARARGAVTRLSPAPDRELAIACGEVVRVRWRGRELIAPAGKGFEYLAALLTAPGREVHVSELVGDDDRGDAGELLDPQALGAYRARARELRAELDDARDRNDLGRAERLGAELDALEDQLAAATGLGGRARRAGSHVERARVNVQRRIKDAIRRLAAMDAELGRYLDATIRTGMFCGYSPV